MLITQKILRDFLNDLFSEYDKKKVEYCLLRNYETLPDRLESRDVDLLISSDFREINIAIVKAIVKKHGLIIYNRFVDERFEQFFIYKRISSSVYFQLELDFKMHGTELYGVQFLHDRDILKSKIPYRNFYVANDAYKVLDKWLFGHLLGAPLPQKYHSEFVNIFINNSELLTSKLTTIFGEKYGEELYSQICAYGFEKLPKISRSSQLRILFRSAFNTPFFHAVHIPIFFLYRLQCFVFPRGEFISVSGPDGSGKTTILAGAREQLEKLFGSRPENHGHFRPTALPRIAHIAKRAGAISTVDEDYAEPHRGKPSGFMGSLARFSYYLLDYLWGYFTKIRPALVRRELVIYDRYYFDMVADPGRSRISLPLWIRKLGLKILPLPNTAFFVHVRPEIVRSRKQELPLEKIKELNDAYLDMAKASSLLVLENDATAETAIAKLVDTVIERRRKRFGLDQRYP